MNVFYGLSVECIRLRYMEGKEKMSLRVWLPLTKDLRNQGLDDVTVTNNGATFNSAGKLGGCYQFNASGYLKETSFNWTNFNTSEFSLCCWYKEPSPVASGNSQMICIGTNSGWNNIRIGLLRCNNSGYPMFSVSDGTNNVNYNFMANNFNLDVWNHIVCTYNNGTMKMYLNGILHKTATTTIVPALNSSQHLGIGAASNGAEPLTGYLNDVRIYDHCLSPMEVKELSKGLILHYPLNRGGLGPSNLLKNGFGELGSENWNSDTNISTSDIPSGQSDIKASFGNGYAIEHIKLYPTHTYKFTTWIKATATSGNTYPSLFPYDVDGKFINNYNCPDGFNLATMTTLKQALKTGDTKIYVNDLSQWNTNSGHYYNWAAIFSYTDGTGQTYPDGTYTQNMGRFGSSTNAKTNLDKTNNIITLLSAYTGPTMPVGTKVCASTEGSTYFYPWGGFSLANIQNWTYKEVTVSGNVNRLRYADYVTFWTYSSNRMAGIKIVDLTNEEMDSITEYDCSGFCNNGTRMGTFSWTSDTPKYSVSTSAQGSSGARIIGPGMSAEAKSAAIWVRCAKTVSSVFFADKNSTLECGLLNSLIYANTTNSAGFTTTHWKDNQWNHVVVVNDNGTRRVYVNGEPETASGANNYYMHTTDAVYLWTRSDNNNYPFNGQMSDFRIYATALSASDVKSLYQNSAYIDSNGNVYGAVHNEV